MSGLVDNIRASLLGLKMPRAMEMLDHTVQRLEFAMWPPSVRGPWRTRDRREAIDGLLSEESDLSRRSGSTRERPC